MCPNARAEETHLTDAEKLAFSARCLLRAAGSAVLATQSAGQPHASLVTPAVLPDGAVLMLLSSLSAHTSHLQADPRCAVMAAGQPTGPNPQTAPRVTVTGTATPELGPASRAFWVARHPYAAFYADFTDFSVWRLTPQAGQYVGGFALAAKLPAAAFAPPSSAVAAVQEGARRIVDRCNTDHAEALNRLAHLAGEFGPWRMLTVDTDGFDMVQDEKVLRVPWDEPVGDASAVRAALLRLVHAERVRR